MAFMAVSPSSGLCYYCKYLNHVRANCPKLKKDEKTPDKQKTNTPVASGAQIHIIQPEFQQASENREEEKTPTVEAASTPASHSASAASEIGTVSSGTCALARMALVPLDQPTWYQMQSSHEIHNNYVQ